MKALAASLALAAAAVFLAAFAPPQWRWDLPPGVAPPPVPADNPMSAAKVELGRRLFYDGDLSVDGTVGCFNCHGQHRGFTESNAVHPGVKGAPGRRNAMMLGNVAYLSALTWADPRQRSLEAQVLTPLTGEHPVEMGMKGQEAELTRRLSADACYRRQFAEAFPGEPAAIDVPHVAKAIAAFERTLVSFGSAYDRGALDEAAKRGQGVFATLGCAACHKGRLFTDADAADPLSAFHRIEPANARDPGLSEITGKTDDAGRFRTPSLRNVALSSPYLHDGSAKTLAEAIRRHDGAAGIGDAEMADLTAFLGALTDQTFVTDPKLGLPKTRCGKPL
ncbi:cytochrome-c peroxidase [Phenylobacterium sp.]|uniref:cytochrome-c peroxidase n=1 Tax=Phenylobacterium sp. TaxID=1871053 RepID=UPI002CBD50E9|nr:cytochrome c peroxidase [Phenylobacterium sp.]HLZ76786.1 cytochrome c peroxidase [Phenylobacterium sp.]